MSVTNFGGRIKLHDGAQLAEIADVRRVDFPNPERGTYRNTNHAETSGAHTYHGEELLEPGTMTVQIGHVAGSATAALVVAAAADPEPRAFERYFPGPNGTTYMVSGAAILTSAPIEPQETTGEQLQTLNFQLSGGLSDPVLVG